MKVVRVLEGQTVVQALQGQLDDINQRREEIKRESAKLRTQACRLRKIIKELRESEAE